MRFGSTIHEAYPGAAREFAANYWPTFPTQQPNTMITTETIQPWARLKMLPSLLQPRTNFPSGPLNELGLTMRQKGVQQPLLVRLIPCDVFTSEAGPDDWGVWSRPWQRLVAMGLNKEAADQLAAEILGGGIVEIADGERRWRAGDSRPHPSEALRMEAMDELPVIVRDMSDVDVLELMLVSAIQRQELSELEECDAFHRALAQRNADGTPAHTVASLCAKLGGKSEGYVRQRLALRKLPAEGREGLRDGKFSFRIARELCGAPVGIVPELLDVVLHPRKFPAYRDADDINSPLTLEELQELIQMKSRVLDRAPFDLKDAHVLAVSTDDAGERLEGGACADCPFNTAVRSVEEAMPARRTGRPDVARCLHPGCYDRKVEIHVSAALIKLEAAGATVLKGKEAERVLHGGPAKGVSLSYVELDAKLAPDERAKNIDERHAPTWRAIVTGTATAEVKKRNKAGDVEAVESVTADLGVTPTVVVDGHGQVRQFVERKVAAEAAQKTGTAHLLTLSSGRGVSLAESDEAKRVRLQKERERDAQKVRSAASRKIMEAVAAKVESGGLGEAFWPAALPLAVRHAGNAGCVYVANRRGIPRGNDVYAAVKAAGAKLKGRALQAFIVELLLAQDVSYCDSPHSSSLIPDSAKPVLKLLGIDATKIKKTVESDFAAEKKRVAAAAKEKAKKSAKTTKKAFAKVPQKISPEGRAKLAVAMVARWSARKVGAAAPAKLKPGQMKCCYCDYTNSPNGFSSHACKLAPDVEGVSRFATTGTRLLTIEEIQRSRIESGLKPSPRIARELAKKEPAAGVLAKLSAEMTALMEKLNLSFKQVDKIAVMACGRKWADFQGEDDYTKTIAAMEKLTGNPSKAAKADLERFVTSPDVTCRVMSDNTEKITVQKKPDVLIEEDEYQRTAAKVREHFALGQKVSVAKIQTKLKLGYQESLGMLDAMIDAGEIVGGVLMEPPPLKKPAAGGNAEAHGLPETARPPRGEGSGK